MKGFKECVCLLLLAGVILNHTPADARQTDGVSDLWLGRARSLTEELVKDSDSLGR